MKSFESFVPDSSLVWGQECVPEGSRIDCWPQEGATEEGCVARGCLWCQAEDGIPWCHLPQNYGYRMEGQPEVLPNGYRVSLVRATNISYIGGDSSSLTATFEVQSDYRLRIKVRNNPHKKNPQTKYSRNRSRKEKADVFCKREKVNSFPFIL